MMAFGGPRRPASATAQHYALRPSSHPDSTPFRLPCILSPSARSAQTSTKHPALRLRGGRRTRSLTLDFLVLLQRKYVVDDKNHKVAVQLDIETFEKIEEVLENYGLVQLMSDEEEDEVFDINKA